MDLIAGGFRAQKLLQFALNTSIPFLYWGVHGDQQEKFDFSSEFPHTHVILDPEVFTDNWGLVELLITSPEPPIIGVENG